MKINILPIVLSVAVSAYPTFSFSGGVAPVGATEFTQILNNIELVGLVAKETEGVAISAEQLLTQVETLRTQLLAYQNMITNTKNLPETFWRDVTASLNGLHSAMSEAQSLSFDGGTLDKVLKSKLILDPLFKASGLASGEFEERYDDWQKITTAALGATLAASRMTIKDVESEAAIIDRIQTQGKTVKGQVEAIQVGNELAGSIAHQLAKLRTITASQNEQTAVFQARWLAQMDAAEAYKRKTVKGAETIDRKEPGGRNLIGSFTRGDR